MCCGTVDSTILFKRTNTMNTGLASLFIITVATETLVRSSGWTTSIIQCFEEKIRVMCYNEDAMNCCAAQHTGVLLRVPLCVACVVLMLIGCTTVPATEEPQAGGGFSPEVVTESFFEDLQRALQDPNLRQEEARSFWAERLSGYFAPAERDTQRLALRRALASFATGLRQLADDETAVFEFRGFEPVEKIADDGERALVRLPSATISMMLMRTNERGSYVFYEQTISLSQVIGRPDGTVPVIKIDGRWYLTEG
jgi:hypothetical protein